MKVGCCAYSFRQYLTSGQMTLEDFIHKAHAMGLDGVELTAYYFASTEASYLHQLKRLALQQGIEISAPLPWPKGRAPSMWSMPSNGST